MPRLFSFFLLVLLFSCQDRAGKVQGNPSSPEGMVLIPASGEFPAFFMDETEVTNQQFAAFVEATGYLTEAEKPINWEEMARGLPPGTPKPADSLLVPGALVFKQTPFPVDLNSPHLWWRWIPGANWRHPQGPESNLDGLEDHPVVQVSWHDAQAYAAWAGKRLPTEREWEIAAAGAEEAALFPWGNEDPAEKFNLANLWQGKFPAENTLKDGFAGTAPVRSFPANAYGLYDMAGNVWEWTSEQVQDPLEPFAEKYAVKGGSFLCNNTYCTGYRIRSKMSSSADTGLNHTGFRCVKDWQP
ncbi:MAG: SUMF1/EgtB/PvdO family nonheme iron enzyme [Bacteroidia bacterium]|nr:SUMF1/EgtB/PvdO family nonheme iron enzyme [Bacteroidia bacterium]